MAIDNTELSLPDNFFDKEESKPTEPVEQPVEETTEDIKSDNLSLPDNFFDKEEPSLSKEAIELNEPNYESLKQKPSTLEPLNFNDFLDDEDDIDGETFPQLLNNFDPEIARSVGKKLGFNDNETQLAIDLAQTTIFGNVAMGENFEQMYNDNTAISLAFGFVKAASSGAGGLVDLFGGEEDNLFNKKAQQLDLIQAEGLQQALAENDMNTFYLRSINKTAGDVGGQFLIIAKMFNVAKHLTKGKKLSLIAKGKNYKELFKVTSLRSGLLGAYTFLTTTGSLEERTKQAAIISGMSMTPVFTGLSKTNFGAVIKDIGANMALTTGFRHRDAHIRALNATNNVLGKNKIIEQTDDNNFIENFGKTLLKMDDETFNVYKHFMYSEMIQHYSADVVFGAMTRSVKSQVKFPEKFSSKIPLIGDKKIPVIGGFEFKPETVDKKSKPNPISLAKEVYSKVYKGEGTDGKNKYFDLLDVTHPKGWSKKDARKQENNDFHFDESSLAPRRFKEKVLDDKVNSTKERLEIDQKRVDETKKEIKKEFNNKVKSIRKQIQDNLNKEGVKRKKFQLIDENLSYKEIQKIAKSLEIKASGKGVTKQKLINQINAKQKLVDRPIVTRKKIAQGVKETGVAIVRQFSRTDEMADTLDGGKAKYDGETHRILIDNINKGDRNALQIGMFRKQSFDKQMQFNGIKNKDFYKKVYFHPKTQKLTISELMGVYAKSKQPNGYNALLNSNFAGKKDALDAAIKFIESDGRYRQLAEHIIADYATTRGRIAEVYERVTGKAMAEIDFYVPLNRRGVRFNDGYKDVEEAFDIDVETGLSKLDQKYANGKAAISKGFLKKRKLSPEEIKLDLVGEWLGMVQKTEHYIHHADNIKLLNEVFDQNLKSSIDEVYGSSFSKEIQNGIDRAANPNILYQGAEGVEAFLKFSRRSAGIAYLAGNMGTFLKQIPSYLYYMQDLGGAAEGTTRLSKALFDTATNWGVEKMPDGSTRLVNARIRFAEINDPILRSTTVDSVIAEYQRLNPTLYNRYIKTMGKAGFAHIVAIDKIVRSSGWNAVYEKSRIEGKTHEESVRLASNSTQRSQPSNRAVDLPSVYSKGEVFRGVLQFTNQLSKILSAYFQRVPKLAKNYKDAESRKQLEGIIVSHALAGYALYTISTGKAPTDPEEIMKMLFSTVMTGAGPAGSIVNQTVGGYDYSVPAVESIQKITKAGMDIAEGDLPSLYDLEGLGVLAGVPVTGIKKAYRAFDEESIYPLFFPKQKKAKVKYN